MRKRDLVIRFSGLKEGLHDFHFNIDKKFFDQIDYSEIKNAELSIDVAFEKKTNMNVVNINLNGKAEVMCDKCSDDFFVELAIAEEFIYKYGDHISDDEKIIYIPEGEIEIDLTQPVYELAIVALPSRRVHPEGTCNQEMLETMDTYLMVEENEADSSSEDQLDNEEVDPRWAALKNLKTKEE